MIPTQAQFMAALAEVESSGRYWLIYASTSATGKYQIMPKNWRDWAPAALGTDPLAAYAAKFAPELVGVGPNAPRWVGELLIHGDEFVALTGLSPTFLWWPTPTPANQETVANWKIARQYAKLGDWRRVAAAWRSGMSVALQQPAKWSAGTISYVNAVCVPLGYAKVTTATVLPPLPA